MGYVIASHIRLSEPILMKISEQVVANTLHIIISTFSTKRGGIDEDSVEMLEVMLLVLLQLR